jgi:flagellar motor switch protein FliN/FliY
MESLLHDVLLEVSVELGRARLSLGDLAARLAPGSVITLDKASGALLDVRVQSRLIARAEVVAIGERCGIRILELVGGNES